MTAKTIQKYKDKSVPKLVQLAQKHFNTFIRTRDNLGGYFVCISCGISKSTTKMHAGHFYSAGNNAVVRFDEDNVHGQCVKCNTFLHGNLDQYRKNLEIKIGTDRMLSLDLKAAQGKRGFKHDRFSLIEIIEKYKS